MKSNEIDYQVCIIVITEQDIHGKMLCIDTRLQSLKGTFEQQWMFQAIFQAITELCQVTGYSNYIFTMFNINLNVSSWIEIHLGSALFKNTQ